MRHTPIFATLALFACLAGCKSEAEKQVSKVVDKQKEIVSILKGVTDQASAKAAAEKLKAMSKDFASIGEQMQKTKVSDEEQKRLQEKYKPEMEKTGKEMQDEMQRIAKIPGAGMEIMGGMMEIGSASMKASMGKPGSQR